MRGDLISVYNFFTRGSGAGDADLFSLMPCGKMRGNSLKLCQGKFRLDFRKMFFPVKVAKDLNKLPRKVVKVAMVTGLLAFKKCLSNTLR